MLTLNQYREMTFYHSSLGYTPEQAEFFTQISAQLWAITEALTQLQVSVLALQNTTNWRSTSADAFREKIRSISQEIYLLYEDTKMQRHHFDHQLSFAGVSR